MTLPSRRTVLLGLGWSLLFLFVGLAAWLGRIGANVRLYQAAYILGFLGYFIIVTMIVRGRVGHARSSWTPWFLGCVVLRIVPMAVEPGGDVYRYLWEGRIQLAGFNPYVLPPDAPELAALRNEEWGRINHPDHPAIYPPFAELAFILAAAIHPSVFAVKAMFVFLDVGTVALLGGCLTLIGRPPQLAMIYAACPLVLSAFAVEGHLDSLVLVCLTGTVAAVASRRMLLAGVLLGLAVLSKPIALVFLPWFLFRHLRAAALAVGVIGIGCLPYLGSIAEFAGNLIHFAGMGELLSFLGTFGLTDFNTNVERLGVASVLVILVFWASRRCESFTSFAETAVGWLLMLLPVVHYWYFAWVLLFQAFHLRIRWLATSLALVTYFESEKIRLATGEWAMPRWTPLVVWMTFVIAWVGEIILRAHRRNRL